MSKKNMTLEDIQILAETWIEDVLVKEHGITGWKFAFNKRYSAYGVCDYRKKTIFLSAYINPYRNEVDVKNTITHEIAHVLTKHYYGSAKPHGKEWKKFHRSLGGSAEFSSRMTTEQWEAVEAARPKRKTSSNPHLMVNTVDGSIVKRYKRKPAAKTIEGIKSIYLIGKKAETLGKLAIMTESEYNKNMKV